MDEEVANSCLGILDTFEPKVTLSESELLPTLLNGGSTNITGFSLRDALIVSAILPLIVIDSSPVQCAKQPSISLQFPFMVRSFK